MRRQAVTHGTVIAKSCLQIHINIDIIDDSEAAVRQSTCTHLTLFDPVPCSRQRGSCATATSVTAYKLISSCEGPWGVASHLCTNTWSRNKDCMHMAYYFVICLIDLNDVQRDLLEAFMMLCWRPCNCYCCNPVQILLRPHGRTRTTSSHLLCWISRAAGSTAASR